MVHVRINDQLSAGDQRLELGKSNVKTIALECTRAFRAGGPHETSIVDKSTSTRDETSVGGGAQGQKLLRNQVGSLDILVV